MQLAPAQLEDAWVSRVTFALNPQFNRDDLSNVTYELEAEPEIVHIEHDPVGETWAMARLGIKVTWSRRDESDETPDPFALELEIEGMFAWPGGAPQNERMANLWLEYNAIYLLWPYARTYIQQITAFSNVPPLVIYTMSVPDRPAINDDSAHDRFTDTPPEQFVRPDVAET